MFKNMTILASVTLVALWMLPGCGDDGGPHEHDGAPKHHGEHDHDHGGYDDGEHEDAADKLSPEDQTLADAQKTCPVSGQALDSMGGPIKIMHEGRPVFLCCSGCVKEFRADPEKYLKKLPR